LVRPPRQGLLDVNRRRGHDPTVGVASLDEMQQSVADQMAHAGLGMLRVVERADARQLVVLVTRFDLREGRATAPEDERRAERVLAMGGTCTNGTATGARRGPPALERIESLDGAMPRDPRS
jgi:hypothetical protein